MGRGRIHWWILTSDNRYFPGDGPQDGVVTAEGGPIPELLGFLFVGCDHAIRRKSSKFTKLSL